VVELRKSSGDDTEAPKAPRLRRRVFHGGPQWGGGLSVPTVIRALSPTITTGCFAPLACCASSVHTSNNVEATLSNATSRTILSTKSNVASTLLPFLATMLPLLTTMSNEISSFRQSQNKLNMFNLFPLCRKDEISRKTCSTLLPKRQQSRTLLRHCCWCGRGFSYATAFSVVCVMSATGLELLRTGPRSVDTVQRPVEPSKPRSERQSSPSSGIAHVLRAHVTSDATSDRQLSHDLPPRSTPRTTR